MPPPVISGRKRHVVLIVLESTRADAIGRRVDGRSITPTLDAMAARGSSARAAYSHVGFTTFSLQSLFTGELAPVDDRQSLFRDFLANGYQVGVFSGQAEDFGDTAALTGMRRGSIFVDGTMLKDERAFSFAAQGSVNIDGKILLREFDRRFGRREAWTRPHFLYFNLQSAHFPYYNPGMDRILAGEPIPRGEISAANRERVERTYLNAIAYNDRLIAMLIARLGRLGVLDDTLDRRHRRSWRIPVRRRLPRPRPYAERPADADPVHPQRSGRRDARRSWASPTCADLSFAPPAPNTRAERPPVFQYLGTLDRPGSIGMVDAAGQRTIFNLFVSRSDDAIGWTSATSGPLGPLFPRSTAGKSGPRTR